MQCSLCALFVLRRAPSRFRLSIASNALIASAEVNARWLKTRLTTNRKYTWIQRTCVPTAAAKERNQKRLHTLLDANTRNLATRCVGQPSLLFAPRTHVQSASFVLLRTAHKNGDLLRWACGLLTNVSAWRSTLTLFGGIPQLVTSRKKIYLNWLNKLTRWCGTPIRCLKTPWPANLVCTQSRTTDRLRDSDSRSLVLHR